jgi:hypothetical protein
MSAATAHMTAEGEAPQVFHVLQGDAVTVRLTPICAVGVYLPHGDFRLGKGALR